MTGKIRRGTKKTATHKQKPSQPADTQVSLHASIKPVFYIVSSLLMLLLVTGYLVHLNDMVETRFAGRLWR